MGHRLPLARKFNVDCGCNVFMLSYRGYGKSQGHASELGESPSIPHFVNKADTSGMRIDVEVSFSTRTDSVPESSLRIPGSFAVHQSTPSDREDKADRKLSSLRYSSRFQLR